MFNDSYDLIDDFLIDDVFQPICDRIRKTFGWSKRVPIAIMKLLMIMGITPAFVAICLMGNIYAMLFAAYVALWIIAQTWFIITIIRDEMRDQKSPATNSSAFLDGYRVTGKGSRSTALLLSVFLIPFVLAGISIPEVSYESSFYSIALLANLGDDFFKACTDLPRGKSVFARMKDWFRVHALRPVPHTS